MTVSPVDPARVLAILDRLIEVGLAAYSLSEIDGAFYWCAFRASDIDPLFGIRARRGSEAQHQAAVRRLLAEPVVDQDGFKSLIRSWPANPNDMSSLAQVSPIAYDLYLRDRLLGHIAGSRELQDLAYKIILEYPTLNLWMGRKERVSLRGMRVAYVPPGTYATSGQPKLVVQIQERSTTGTAIAKALHEMATHSDYFGRNPDEAELNPALVELNSILLQRLDVGEIEEQTFYSVPLVEQLRGPLMYPVGADRYRIEIEAGLPLPPHEVIATYYNTVVRDRLGWDKSLADTAHNQDQIPAAYTWAIGLLATSGGRWTFRSAIGKVCQRLKAGGVFAKDAEDIARTTFERAREQLSDRVGIQEVTDALRSRSKSQFRT